MHSHILCAKLFQSCPSLCDPIRCSLTGSSVRRILQARILEWVAMPSSRGSSQPKTEATTLTPLAMAGGFFTTSAMWETHIHIMHWQTFGKTVI